MAELGLAVLGLLVLVPLDHNPEAASSLKASEVVNLVLHSEARPRQDLVDRVLALASQLHSASNQHLEPKPPQRLEDSHQHLVVKHLGSVCPP